MKAEEEKLPTVRITDVLTKEELNTALVILDQNLPPRVEINVLKAFTRSIEGHLATKGFIPDYMAYQLQLIGMITRTAPGAYSSYGP